jgi:hypothetical protein
MRKSSYPLYVDAIVYNVTRCDEYEFLLQYAKPTLCVQVLRVLLWVSDI